MGTRLGRHFTTAHQEHVDLAMDFISVRGKGPPGPVEVARTVVDALPQFEVKENYFNG